MIKILIITLLVIGCISDLPVNFTWGLGGQRNLLTPSSNQNNPNRCESGWAFATINSISTRINIQMYKTRFKNPLVSLSPQVLLQCNHNNFGCLGGQPYQAFKWIKQHNITDSSCKNYKAKGYTNGVDCLSRSKCQYCESKYNCKYQINSKIYSLSSIGSVAGEANMKKQIYSNGPIACGIAATNEFKVYKNGIFNDKTKAYQFNHYVSVYGWGLTANNESYWLVQNSYGPNWGQEGNIKIVRGINNIGIESACYFGIPQDTWTQDIRNHTVGQSNKLTFKTSQPQVLPLLTSTLSGYNPNFCQASWAFSVVQAIADAQYVKTNYQTIRKFSIQALLNCGVGTCQKGDAFDALVFIHKYGIPQEGCQQYRAENPESGSTCTPVNNCANCAGNSIFKSNCSQVKGYKRWYIQSYGTVSGQAKMKIQLTNHQTLICGIQLSHAFRQYKGGIFSEISVSPKINYYVQVVGFGSQNNQNYWLGRAFFGTSWGISGFFKIKAGSANLGIQTKCYWAGPLV